jgi:phospholipid/cholesterol/gamma-HCH transport system ATP-binding protein
MSNETAERPIQVNNLRKTFGQQKVLDGINLEVRRGETVAVLGRSGSGKSVLLKLMIGLQSADSGSVRMVGQEMANLDTKHLNTKHLNEIRKKVGFLFQQAALYDSLSVGENVEFPLARHTDLSPENRQSRVRELLASVGMEQEAEKMPSEISGGMQKRVGLARALALDPEILLFDEPTAGLDPITAGEIGKLIMELKQKRKMTAVVVTHDLRTAKSFADRLLLIRDGNILAEGTFADLQKSREQFVVQFLGDGL